MRLLDMEVGVSQGGRGRWRGGVCCQPGRTRRESQEREEEQMTCFSLPRCFDVEVVCMSCRPVWQKCGSLCVGCCRGHTTIT